MFLRRGYAWAYIKRTWALVYMHKWHPNINKYNKSIVFFKKKPMHKKVSLGQMEMLAVLLHIFFSDYLGIKTEV